MYRFHNRVTVRSFWSKLQNDCSNSCTNEEEEHLALSKAAHKGNLSQLYHFHFVSDVIFSGHIPSLYRRLENYTMKQKANTTSVPNGLGT